LFRLNVKRLLRWLATGCGHL